MVHARNAGGQVLSAVTGCIVHLVLGRWVWLSGAVGMSLSLVVMMLTKTTHPVRFACATYAACTSWLAGWPSSKCVV